MNPDIFREYDIRGIAARDLDPSTVTGLGRAYGSVIAEAGGTAVAVGMDVRETSPRLRGDLEAGILAAGVDVVRLGLVPTPLAYYAVHRYRLDGCVQITGSHNPVAYNGFKMMAGKGSVYGEAIQELRGRIETGRFASGEGSVTDRDPTGEYLDDLCGRLSLDRPLRVVIDAGNGCASEIGPALFRRLGCEVEEVFCTYDGTFPNHIPDPTLPETLGTLRERVAAAGSDLGLAFDGDADRLGALDETGAVLWGDQLLALVAREVLAENPGAEILFDVKCSKALIDDIEAHGGTPVMTPTGHSLIKAAMQRTGAPLAGEMSGHLFFADAWYGFDDALYAAARLARLVAASGSTLSAMAADLPRYHATPEIRIDCPDDRKFAVVGDVLERYRPTHPLNDVDGARIEFDGGWGLVRASNTQPVLVLRAEGDTPDRRDAIEADLRGALVRAGVIGAGPGTPDR